jgi:hypothetical protein
MRGAGLVERSLHGGVGAGVEEGERHGGDPHQRPVAGAGPVAGGRLGGGVAVGVAERPTGVDTDVVGRRRPHPEPREQVVQVEPAVGHERLGEHERHLGVIGELPRRPPERPTPTHLTGGAPHRVRKLGREPPRRAELVRSAQGVADGCTDQCADRPLQHRRTDGARRARPACRRGPRRVVVEVSMLGHVALPSVVVPTGHH